MSVTVANVDWFVIAKQRVRVSDGQTAHVVEWCFAAMLPLSQLYELRDFSTAEDAAKACAWLIGEIKDEHVDPDDAPAVRAALEEAGA